MRNLELGSKRVRGKKKRRNIRKLVTKNAVSVDHTKRRLILRDSSAITEASLGLFGVLFLAAGVAVAVAEVGVAVPPGVSFGAGVDTLFRSVSSIRSRSRLGGTFCGGLILNIC